MSEETRESSIFGNKQWFRCKDLSEMLSMGQSTIYKMVKAGTFPKPVAITPKLSVFRKKDIEIWMDDKTKVPNNSHSQELKKALVNARDGADNE